MDVEIQNDSENAGEIFLTTQEVPIVEYISTLKGPYGQRAKAILGLNAGLTQVQAGDQAGLTRWQVKYWIGKFRNRGISIFPEEMRNKKPEVNPLIETNSEETRPLTENVKIEKTIKKKTKSGKRDKSFDKKQKKSAKKKVDKEKKKKEVKPKKSKKAAKKGKKKHQGKKAKPKKDKKTEKKTKRNKKGKRKQK